NPWCAPFSNRVYLFQSWSIYTATKAQLISVFLTWVISEERRRIYLKIFILKRNFFSAVFQKVFCVGIVCYGFGTCTYLIAPLVESFSKGYISRINITLISKISAWCWSKFIAIVRDIILIWIYTKT